ncbi:MAG: translation initiation factor IF-6 [Candidatus Micrarchaeaceae archaeon]
MGIIRCRILGNSYVGAFLVPTDKYVLVAKSSSQKERDEIESALGVNAIGVSIDGSDLIGIYIAANSKGVLLPFSAREEEVKKIKEETGGEVRVMKTKLNALRCNILANDKLGLVNVDFTREEVKEIEDVLDIEVIKKEIGNYKTPGANCIMTNKGFVATTAATDEEMEEIRKIFPNAAQSTANLGSKSIGICCAANSKGLVVGELTTGYELGRISDALML